MLALVFLWGCYGAGPADSPYTFVGTWRVATYTAGSDCNFPQEEDYGARYVKIEVPPVGESVVGVYPCSSETVCDGSFSDFELTPIDAASASGVASGLDWADGLCDMWWIRSALSMDGENVVITGRNEVNAADVPAGSTGECGPLQEAYDGPFSCLRTEELVLEPL